MYELEIESGFRAAHAIVMNGVREAAHEHDWRVRVVVEGEALDGDGLLCDFHELEARLEGAVARLRNVDLNVTEPFDRVNPTAEAVARHLAEVIGPGLPRGVRLQRVQVTEAPGCRATYRTREHGDGS